MWKKPEEGQEKPRLSWLDRLKGKDIEQAEKATPEAPLFPQPAAPEAAPLEPRAPEPLAPEPWAPEPTAVQPPAVEPAPAPVTEIPRDDEGEPIDSQAAISEMPAPAVQVGPVPEAMLPPEAAQPPSPAPEGLEPPVAPVGAETPPPEGEKKGFWAKTWEVLNTPVFTIDSESITKGLEKTREGFVKQVRKLTATFTKIDDDTLEELEELLLESDMGVTVADGALKHLRTMHKAGELTPQNVAEALEAYLADQLGEKSPIALREGQLNIIMLVGVNGVGKTTTLGKLANRFQIQGKKVLVAAADTFRAAAIDQLVVWAERAGVDIIRHKEGGDAAAVVFDAMKASRARNVDVLLIDTAGRLHNKANLMEELRKIRKIIDREAPDVPLEVLLVLDATTGQNGVRQAEVFTEATPLTGVILTKLDGTAKGGVVFGIRSQLGLPVKVVGLGEKVEDLKDFDPEVFVDALFAREESL
jgi:fused signal recognition particle receptor